MPNFPSLEEVLGLSYKSLWEPDRLYLKNDVVEYFSNFYVCINTNNGAAVSDTNSWVLLKDHPSISDSLGIANTATPNSKGLIKSNLAIASGVPIAVTQPVAFTPPPPLSEWTWAHQGLTVAEDVPGGIRFTVGANDTNTHTVLKRDLPASPYTITAAFYPNMTYGGTNYGLIVFNSGTHASKSFFAGNGEPAVYANPRYYDDFDTVAIAPPFGFISSISLGGLHFTAVPTDILWLRVSNDGVNFTYSASTNGDVFVQIAIVPKNEFTDTEDSFGILGMPKDTDPTYDNSFVITLVSLEVTTP